MSKRLLACWPAVGSAILVLASASVSANILPVQDEAEFLAAMAAATAGDTVSVDCGTYHLQGLSLVDGVTLRSATGQPDCVEILSDGTAPILACDGVSAQSVIEGLTLALDAGVAESSVPRGGGLLISDGSPLVNRCVFRGLIAAYGGAVACQGAAAPTIIFCRFEGNQALTVGGAINAPGGTAPRLIGCVMTANQAGVSGGAVNAAAGARVELSNCTVDGGGAAQAPLNGWDNGVIALNRTIVIAGSWSGDASAVPTAECSDFFLGGADPWVGLLEPLGQSGGNFSADPLFCEPDGAGFSYELAAESPCAPDQSGACGQIGAFGVGCSVSSVPDDDSAVRKPVLSRIEGNHPNPFNPTTTIRYSLSAAGPVRLTIYDVQGRVVRHLIDGLRAAGPHQVGWDGRTSDGHACAAGVYFARLQADDRTTTHRMSLIK